MPQCLKAIGGKEYTVLLKIKEINISKSFHVYWACNICNGFIHWEGNNAHTTDKNNTTSTQVRCQNTYLLTFSLSLMSANVN